MKRIGKEFPEVEKAPVETAPAPSPEVQAKQSKPAVKAKKTTKK